jgi:TonB family protein
VKVLTPEGKHVRIREVGSVTAAKIVTKVQPIYPPLARQTRIQGTVRLHTIVGTDGSVKQLEVISGHPLLVQSALDAVRQWKYSPTLLEGKPVEVDTTIDVIFALSQDGPAQDPPKLMTLAPNTIDPVLRADVLKMLDENDSSKTAEAAMRKMFDGMRPMMLKGLAGVASREKIVDWYENRLVELLKSGDYREGVVTAYAKYFDDNDVKALMAFYATPTGKKFNEAMPQFYTDLVGLGQTLVEAKLPDIFKEMCKEFPELQGKLPQCPAQDPDKKSALVLPNSVMPTLAK